MPPDPRVARHKLIQITLVVIIVFFSTINCENFSKKNVKETSKSSSPSLFDSLPLNGALVIDSVDNLPVLRRNPLRRLKSRFSNNGTTLSSPSHLIKLKRKIKPGGRGENQNHEQQEAGEGVKSLFDLLPDQGAMVSKVSKDGDAKDQDLQEIVNPRNQRSSQSKRYDNFEIEHQKPTSEFSLSFFNTKLIPPILKSLTQSQSPRIPVLASPSVRLIQPRESYGGPHGGYSNGPSPPPQQIFLHHDQQHYNKVSNAVRVSQDNYKAPSGGSSVYIYADSHQQQPIQNSYGPPSYQPPPPQIITTTTTTPAPKNEIHYHYHINKAEEKEKPKEPKDPEIVYGVPQQQQPDTQYRAPLRRPTGSRSPSNNYGPPPRNRGGYPPSKGGYSKGGYSNSQHPPQPVYNSPQPSQDGYGSSSTTTTPPPSNQQVVPILSGNRKNVKSFRNSDFIGQTDYDDFTNDRTNDDSYDPDDEERFKSRTLLTINRYQQQPQDSPSNSYGPPPSTSYGPPPPQQQYGPPAPPPSQPPQNDEPRPLPPVQSQSAQTSITIETIPITTTETRLVTVPKITQTLGGSSQIPAQFDPPGSNQQQSSGGYGSYNEPPAPPPNNNNNFNPSAGQQQQNSRNLLHEQLLQLTPSRGGLPDFTDIETLALLQSQNAQRNPLLTDLLLSQVSNVNLRGHPHLGSHLGSPFLQSHSHSDLRNSILSTHNAGLRNIGNHGFGSIGSIPLSGGVTVNNLPLLAGLNGGGGNFHVGNNLRGGGTVLTGDAVGAISDLIREQKLQSAVMDLRSRLRYQNRDAERTRQNYRSLFYKGALLLAGLSLIPTVATVASPALGSLGLATAATVGGTSSSLSLSSLLPLTTGRRRREVGHEHTIVLPDMTKMMKTEALEETNFLIPRNSTNKSLFDLMAFKGALIPSSMHKQLEKYLPSDEILRNSQCLQKYFCENLLQIERLPNPTPFLLLLAGLSSDVEKNPWLREAMTAAKNNSCLSFYCYKDSVKRKNEGNFPEERKF